MKRKIKRKKPKQSQALERSVSPQEVFDAVQPVSAIDQELIIMDMVKRLVTPLTRAPYFHRKRTMMKAMDILGVEYIDLGHSGIELTEQVKDENRKRIWDLESQIRSLLTYQRQLQGELREAQSDLVQKAIHSGPVSGACFKGECAKCQAGVACHCGCHSRQLSLMEDAESTQSTKNVKPLEG